MSPPPSPTVLQGNAGHEVKVWQRMVERHYLLQTSGRQVMRLILGIVDTHLLVLLPCHVSLPLDPFQDLCWVL